MSDAPIQRTAEITFKVSLDGNHLPVSIEWDATDSDHPGPKSCKSIMLSIWNEAEQKAQRIDLWTRDMRVDEMTLFALQTLMTMADTLERATHNDELSAKIREFCHRLMSA